jgi:hypothetical protein
MEEPIDRVLRQLIATCPSPGELTMRVRRSLGDQQVPKALRMAAEIRGIEWVDEGVEASRMDTVTVTPNKEIPKRSASAPENAVIFLGLVALALLMLFPPHFMPLTDGLVNNLGFGSIFNPPRSGELRALVNVPLLVTLMTGTVVLTCGATYIARSFSRSDA